MTDADKGRQLRKFKWLATGLFLFMLVLYCFMIWLGNRSAAAWIGYISAFAEAAMVGALADWFAVTALFHHPLNLPIPHTNLIEKSKERIGDNLGNFVVNNFLTATTIRPYIQKLSVSSYLANWLGIEKNKKLLISEAMNLLGVILRKADDTIIIRFAAEKGALLLKNIPLNLLAANGLRYFLDQGTHRQLVAMLAGKIKEYVSENKTLVRDKVKDESYFFIPSFIDNKLADKITSGLERYLEEIIEDPEHRVYSEVDSHLTRLTEQLRTDPAIREKLKVLSATLLPPEKLEEYALAAWTALKSSLQEELGKEQSTVKTYLAKTVEDLTHTLQNDPKTRQRIDGWIQHLAYKYILRNAKKIGTLIADTVGNWKGRELSRKLELEVGKDLQYIRINGTLVGGLLGLVIYTLTHLLR